MNLLRPLAPLAALALAACARNSASVPAPSVATVPQVFRSPEWPGDEIDSLALWKNADGGGLLVATGKESDLLYVLDPKTGALLRTVGGSGAALGQFDRPNGVVVAGDLLLVVERDNRRVQALALPSLEPAFAFGEAELAKPYGIDAWREASGSWRLVVTDDFDILGDPAQAAEQFARRVKQYRVDGGRAEFLGAFGDTTPEGRLAKVETILADAENGRILVVDETAKAVRVYDLDGKYTGRTFGAERIVGDPEGLGLYAPSNDPSAGIVVATDQRPEITIFHAYSRADFRHLGSFTVDPRIANTDGICLANGSFGPFEGAALFAMHDDKSVAAVSFADVLRTIEPAW